VKGGRRQVACLILFVLLASSAFATSCVWGKKFKVRRVCGQVKDVYGGEIPNATVQLTRQGRAEIVGEAQTAADGMFALDGIASGDYEIRIKYAGFWDASQDFRVVRPARVKTCSQPIRVVMKPAGSCSYVENAWKK
jgi:Carboxypeptidase regulatory-like domain